MRAAVKRIPIASTPIHNSSSVVTELIPDFLNPPIFDPQNLEMIARIFSCRIRRIRVVLIPHHYDKRTVGEFQYWGILPLWFEVLTVIGGEAVNELFQAVTVNGLDGIVLDEG